MKECRKSWQTIIESFSQGWKRFSGRALRVNERKSFWHRWELRGTKFFWLSLNFHCLYLLTFRIIFTAIVAILPRFVLNQNRIGPSWRSKKKLKNFLLLFLSIQDLIYVSFPSLLMTEFERRKVQISTFGNENKLFFLYSEFPCWSGNKTEALFKCWL